MKFISLLFFIIGLTLLPIQAKAQKDSVGVGSKWNWDGSKASIEIDLSGALKETQLKTLNSGFSTYSQMQIEYITKDNDEIEISKTSCTVKYDAWEEIFFIAKLDNPPQAANVKTLEKYFDFCLKIEIEDPAVVADFVKKGGEILITLRVEQISKSQSEKIKEWLINQQSGVMQGLFSHMLEGLTQSETLKVVLPIAPLIKGEINQTSKSPKKNAG